MKWIRLILIFTISSGLFTSCKSTINNSSDINISITENLIYHTVDGRNLKLDLTMPDKKKGPFPVIIYIHGTKGDKSNFRQEQMRQSSRGYVTASIEHREDYYPPNGVYDVKTAIRWLRLNSAEYQINPDKIALLGFSRGGHRGLLAGLSYGNSDYDGDSVYRDISAEVQAIVNLSAVFFYDNQPNLYRRIGGSPEEVPERYSYLNTINLVRKGMPPVLSISGGDNDYYKREAKEFDKKTTLLNLDCIWMVREGYGHDYSLLIFKSLYNPVDNFLDFYLKD